MSHIVNLENKSRLTIYLDRSFKFIIFTMDGSIHEVKLIFSFIFTSKLDIRVLRI